MKSIDEVKEKALEEHIPIIMDDSLDVVKDIIKKIKPKRILEIGTATGYSSICFAKTVIENCKDEESSSIIIDTIELDEARANKAIENIKKMDLERNINVIIGNAVEILPTLNEKYDAVIIADNILYKGYVMSNYNKHKQRTAVTHLREYIKLATEDEKLNTKILEVGDGLAISNVLIWHKV